MSLRLPFPYRKNITLQHIQNPNDLVFLQRVNRPQIPDYINALCMLHQFRLYRGRLSTPENTIAICPAPQTHEQIWHLITEVIVGKGGLYSGSEILRTGRYNSVIPTIGSILDFRYNHPSSGFVMELG